MAGVAVGVFRNAAQINPLRIGRIAGAKPELPQSAILLGRRMRHGNHAGHLGLSGGGPILAVARKFHQIGESQKEIEVAAENLAEELLGSSVVGEAVPGHSEPVGSFE